jgi:hypothetical protein
MTQQNKNLVASFGRVFVTALLAQFIASGGDVFALDADGGKAILGAGIAALALSVLNYLRPGDTRFGRGSDGA